MRPDPPVRGQKQRRVTLPKQARGLLTRGRSPAVGEGPLKRRSQIIERDEA
jgi:hypothetical protein